MIRRKLYFYNVLQKEKKHKTLIFFAKLWMIILLFFQAKKIRKKYCVEKKNYYYTILNAFFSEGAKVGFFSLVRFGWTNKLRQNQNICSNSNAFCVLIKTFIF